MSSGILTSTAGESVIIRTRGEALTKWLKDKMNTGRCAQVPRISTTLDFFDTSWAEKSVRNHLTEPNGVESLVLLICLPCPVGLMF